jgi:acyl carrier protein
MKMTRQEALVAIAEILEEDPEAVLPGDELSRFDAWDSMGILGMIALLDREFSTSVTTKEIEAARTVGDLLALSGVGE